MKYHTTTLKCLVIALAASITTSPFAVAEERAGDIYVAPAQVLNTNGSTLANDIAFSMIRGNTVQCLRSATLSGIDAQGQVFSAPVSFANFPTDGTSFAVLSSGITANAGNGPATTYVSTSMGGPSLPGSDPYGSPDGLTSYDVVTLTLDFALPAAPGNLSFDWKLGSDEPPTYTYGYPDYLRADVTDASGTSNIAMFPGAIDATARNMVLNGFSNVPTGSSSLPSAPFPTPNNSAYNAMTDNVQTATYSLSASGASLSIAFRVADVNDAILDTAALLDNLKIEGCDAVNVDIKPGSYPNSINACSQGNVPVAVLGSEVLDVTQIEPATVTLADAGVKLVGKSNKLLCSVEDVNNDSYPDLVCHMETMDLGLGSGDSTATVTAQLLNGAFISGSDSVNIVKDECY